MNMGISNKDRCCLHLAVTYWIDNVAQEDTDKDEFTNMVHLQQRLSTIPEVTKTTSCSNCGHARGMHTRIGQRCYVFDCNCSGFVPVGDSHE